MCRTYVQVARAKYKCGNDVLLISIGLELIYGGEL